MRGGVTSDTRLTICYMVIFYPLSCPINYPKVYFEGLTFALSSGSKLLSYGNPLSITYPNVFPSSSFHAFASFVLSGFLLIIIDTVTLKYSAGSFDSSLSYFKIELNVSYPTTFLN